MSRRTRAGVAGFRGSSVMSGGVFDFLHRNARIALAVCIIGAAVSAAGTIGWITAPVA